MSIGQAIAARRNAFRLSEEEVAELAGIPASTVRSVERSTHRPTAYELACVAGALAVDPALLWRGEAGLDDPRRGSARFLAGPTLGGLTARDHRLLARAAEVGRIGAGLWNLLGKRETALRGAALDKSGRRQALLSSQAAGQDVVATHAVAMGSMSEVTLWGHLRTSSKQA